MAAITAFLSSDDQGHLKAELQNLRRKGALKTSVDWENTGADPDRTCGRCRIELGRVINRGAYCRACRLKVCKSCREYSFRTTDWVCTVCHKHMEIQAASGEWMNEFVRRPSRRRDNRVYVPAADIIKRTIRRSWTISNPTPRWNAIRGSPELRPYNSLPRGQDINNFPTLALHQNLKNQQEQSTIKSGDVSPQRKHSPCRRTQSEDVYADKPSTPNIDETTKRPQRINPLIQYADKQNKSSSTPRRRLQQTKSDVVNNENCGKEKRVSFEKNITNKIDDDGVVVNDDGDNGDDDNKAKSTNVTRTQSLNDKATHRSPLVARRRTKTDENGDDQTITTTDVHFAKEETTPIELCDIEPLSGTVFRKVTVRRRRQDMRKLPAVDTGWRRGPESGDLLDILLPEGDDYKLVFISSDSSSKEEDIDDNDSSSTASSYPIDECDWDYFEPGTTTSASTSTSTSTTTATTAASTRSVLNWSSPFGSPNVYRRNLLESPLGSPIVYRKSRESDTGTDDDNNRLESGSPDGHQDEEILDQMRNERVVEEVALQCVHQSVDDSGDNTPRQQSCQSCGAPTQFIPIPVPVPIPFPVPAVWTAQEAIPLILYGSQNLWNLSDLDRLRVLPRHLWTYMSQTAFIWPLINTGESNHPGLVHTVLRGSSECGTTDSVSMPVIDGRNNENIVVPIDGINIDRNLENHNIDNTNNNNNNNNIADNEYELSGYVESEMKYASSVTSTSSETSKDSDISDNEENNTERSPRVCRVYNINGNDRRYSDDALPSSNLTSDGDEDEHGRNSHSSAREDDMSLSDSSYTDSDDTGTVTKRFSRTFVVNKNLSSSSNDDDDNDANDNHSSSSDTDTSDNDTDTEMDCTVILTNIKHLSEEEVINRININNNESKINQQSIDESSTIDPLKDNDNCDNREISNFSCNREIEDFPEELSGSLQKVIDFSKPTTIESKLFKETDYISSSPGLSDVSAESLNSSDVEQQVLSYEAPDDDDDDDDGKKSEVSPVCSTPPIITTITTTMTSEWKTNNVGIRSDEPVNVVGESRNTSGDGERAGVLVTSSEPDVCVSRHAARYTSLVMITQESAPTSYQQVSVVTSDTTTLVPDNDVIVKHTNWQNRSDDVNNEDRPPDNQSQHGESVTVITGGDTLSAFEEGLADDDSWVENLSHDEDDDFTTNSPTDDSTSGEEVTLTCSAAIDQEDELRGYHRAAIDFTLHTIVEESCEESEVEQSLNNKEPTPNLTTDLEKYFFFRLGDGATVPSSNSNREDAFSEASSICSEGLDSLGITEETQQSQDNSDLAEMASSRLEKYFLSGFMGFTAERRDSDGSVGSDSEGKPSPEQRRKRLVRARGTGRSHSSSLDNLLTNPDLSGNDQQQSEVLQNSENSSTSDSDTYDEANNFEKSDGQFDTVKRKKGKKQKSTTNSNECLETTQEVNEAINQTDEDEDGHKTPQPEMTQVSSNLTTNKNQQSRDSGFIGSCDDLLRDQRDNNNTTPEIPKNNKNDVKTELENIGEEKRIDGKCQNLSTPPATSLTRKDSFNNWSSDEETNLMMCKMRQFFKTMVANSQSSKPTTPNLNSNTSPKPVPSPRVKNRCKPPQLVYFENELTRLMKTVPGIRDDQVREIVEYLSSEDTWSDSYDSSDYTSSDLEGTTTKTALQQQISDSCQQIINKFDNSVDDEEGDEGDGGIIDESHGLNKETAFVYQKLVASFEKMATGENSTRLPSNTPHNSPPLIAKVMHHIGSRLVALMHEVSSGESHASNSPKTRHYHRRIQQKLSSASTTTTEDDDSTSDSNLPENLANLEDNLTAYNLLPRSRSHDLLVGESRNYNNQSSSGVSDIVEEREISDCERFSWRGSFESALLATDSRNKLSLLSSENSASASALAIAAKRRSAGDLLFTHKSLSREQLDRVRSCGSIGGGNSEDKLWITSANRPTRRRSSVPDATCGSGGSADGEDDDDDEEDDEDIERTLQRKSLQTGTTNSLPRLPTNTPTNNIQKAQSMYHFLPPNAKSARYRPPGFNRLITPIPKRAVSAPGLQPTHQRRGRRSQQHNVPNDDASISEAHSSPMLASRNSSKSATPSPVAPGSRHGTGSISSQDWANVNADDDIDRLVVMHQTRSSLSSLGFRSDSMASVYSGAGEGRYGTVMIKGQVEFGLQYNYKAGALEIYIKQCKDLAPVDAKRNRSDPYVKVYLLPDKSKSGKRKTKVKKHTLNPVFEECLKFHISLNELETRTLWLTVWHSDMFGRNDFLGEVMMTLENKVFDDPTPKWYQLQERTEPFDDVLSFKGDIIVCLKFVPPDMTAHKKGKRSRGTLQVLVKEAKSLTAVKANGTSDPFCKSYLLPDKGRSSKQKTPVAKRTVNPVWNHTFVYDDVTLQELAERCLELTVWDHDRLASNEFLGGVRFSLGTGKHYGKSVDWMDATGKECSLWKSMLERPNFWVEGCLQLRPSLDGRAS